MLQLLTYPMLDNRTGLSFDPGPDTGEFIWPKDSNLFGWQSYLGDDERFQTKTPPYPAVPARIDYLAGLAPAFIGVGDLDLLARESLVYASQLVQAGVPVEFHLYRAPRMGSMLPWERHWQIALMPLVFKPSAELSVLPRRIRPTRRPARKND